jgi:DNA-binding PadR family transcriptional regulator
MSPGLGSETLGLSPTLRPFQIYPLAIYPLRIYARGMPNDKTNAPLTPAVLHILLALATHQRHGYGIMKQVESDSHGKVKMGPGTLYGSLGRMIDAGLIRESDKKVDPKMDDERRVYYKITALGQKTLAAELERYRAVVALAGQKRLLPKAFFYAYGR